jgi:hypothetical protein
MYKMEEEKYVKYIESFNDKEKKAYEIAMEHLKTSFNIEKSVGYIDYKDNEKEKK